MMRRSYDLLVIQQMSFVILMLFLIQIPSMSLAILFKEIPPTSESTSVTETAELVVKWKKNYLLVCDFVANLNAFIARPLLIFILYAFLSFVSFSFSILYRLMFIEDIPLINTWINAYFVLKFLICIIFLGFTSEKIPVQVSYETATYYWKDVNVSIHRTCYK